MSVKLYVEGGGDGKALRIRCQRGFSRFFEKAGFRNRMPAIVACGSRAQTYDRFRTAASIASRRDFPVLLVDSESAVTQTPWLHLKKRDGWTRPDGTTDDQAHLMVQCMESWFLADIDGLRNYFGSGFVEKHVDGISNIEAIQKASVFKKLNMSTRSSQKGKQRGGYRKAADSFDLLEQLDPSKVRIASKHAERLLAILDQTC